MNPTLPTRPSSRVIALTRIALGLLAATVLLGQVAIVPIAQFTAEQYPEFAHLHGPLLVAALGLALLAGVLVGTTFVLVLLVLRSLLRQAISMRVELDEVV
jgi:hypothetical protein